MSKIYISEDTFSAFISVVQKGTSQGMNFFVYDPQNILQSRIWTFSSQAFIPNVKSNDKILKNHKVPVVVSNNINEQSLDGYTKIFFETSPDESDDFLAFAKNRADVGIHKNAQIFQKNGGKWEAIS